MPFVFNPFTGKLDNTGSGINGPDPASTDNYKVKFTDTSLGFSNKIAVISATNEYGKIYLYQQGTNPAINDVRFLIDIYNGGADTWLYQKQINTTGDPDNIILGWQTVARGNSSSDDFPYGGWLVAGNNTPYPLTTDPYDYANPEPLASSPYRGSSTQAALLDHVHQLPTLTQLGAAPASGISPSAISGTAATTGGSNIFSQDQTFSGTNNTAPAQQALSGASLMNRDLVDSRILFGGPYVSPLAIGTGAVTSGGGGSQSNGNSTWGVGNGSTPTAGSSAATLTTPNTGFQFISPDNGVGASGPSVGSGGVINFTQPFAIGFFIELRNGPTTALDVISRVWLGGASTTSGIAGGINNAGFGVRIWRATSTTYNVALYARTISATTTVITGATNASPIVITCNGHNLQNGNLVEITGVGGNTAANGIWTVASATTNTFALSGSTGNGAFTSGGVANKISSPITITAGRVRRMFLYNRGNGTLELHLGAITSTPAITLTGMATYSGTQLPTQSIFFGVGQQSVTDATPFASTVISNMMLIQP
jgi:hypothetical protein